MMLYIVGFINKYFILLYVSFYQHKLQKKLLNKTKINNQIIFVSEYNQFKPLVKGGRIF